MKKLKTLFSTLIVLLAIPLSGCTFADQFNLKNNGIDIKEDSLTLFVNETYELNYSINLNAFDYSLNDIVWSSSDSYYATVNQGKILAKNVTSDPIIIKCATKDNKYSDTCQINIEEGCSDISIDVDEVTLLIDETLQLNVILSPEGKKENVLWISSSPSYASVSSNGLVTARRETSSPVAITATTEKTKLSATCFITVINDFIEITSIDIMPKEITLEVNDSYTLYANITPENATNKKLTWTSNASSYVSVSSTGKILAKSLTNSPITITAKSSNGKVKGTCKVSVVEKEIPATNIYFEQNNIDLSINESLIINPIVVPSNATSVVTITSDDSSIVKINYNVIYGMKIGNTTIRAITNNGLEALMYVHVKTIAVESVKLNKTELSIGKNYTENLIAEILPSNATNKNLSWESSNTDIAFVNNNGVVLAKEIGTATITAKSHNGKTGICYVTVTETQELRKTKLDYDINDFSKGSYYETPNMPTQGNVKMLVIPIWFSDSSKYITNENKNNVRNDIHKAFFGTNGDTGWRSVKTYYQEESFGALNIDGVVTDWYEVDYSSSYVNSSRINSIVSKATDWYKNNYTYDKLSSFDSNKDGFVDSVVLIYGAPDRSASGSYNEDLWAYTYWLQGTAGTSASPKPNTYFWASYDFMYGTERREMTNYFGGDTSYCNIDTHTYIHETGHVLGLMDYYDYSNSYSASGKFSMQDYNIGAHDAYSKMVLGWVKPYVISSSQTITIKPLESSGDVILLSNDFHNSPFDEYILIDLYTPTGLNEFDCQHPYNGSYPQGPLTSGCRIWHIDSRLCHYNSNNRLTDVVDYKPNNNCYYATSNSSKNSDQKSVYGIKDSKFYEYRQLQLIRSNYTYNYKCNESFSARNLFTSNEIFDMNTYGKCFVNTGLFNNGRELPYKISFDSVNSSSATITITRL